MMIDKKRMVLVLLSVALALVIGAVMFFRIIPTISLVFSQRNSEETLLVTSVSPEGTYKLEAYKTQPGATVDFSIKVYDVSQDKRLIYNAYHEYTAEIQWMSDCVVSINGKTLDLSKSETYDWRDNQQWMF